MLVSYSVSNPVVPPSAQTFKGNFINKLEVPIQGKKVFKNATEYQFNTFVNYLNSRAYKLGVTADEVAKLSKHDGLDFVVESYGYLLKKLGIPEEISPVVIPVNMQNEDIGMQYITSQNIINLNIPILEKHNFVKCELFKALRHELQHYLQNTLILRHEVYGEKAVEAYTEQFMNSQRMVFDTLYSNDLIPQLIASQDIPDSEKLFLKSYKNLRDTDNQEALGEFFGAIEQDYKAKLIDFREQIREKMGIIKADHPKSEHIKDIFDEFSNLGYFTPDNRLDYKKYMASRIEQDAILAQERAGFEFSKEGCFMQYVRHQIENLMKDEHMQDYVRKLDESV